MALIASHQIHLPFTLPRTRGKRAMLEDTMRVGANGASKGPPPRLTTVTGVMVSAPDLDQKAAMKALRGWRLYVVVDNAPIIDGAPLDKVYALSWETMRPVRSDDEQIVVLTPRDPPRVDVDIGVEWRGKGKPRRLPKNVIVRILGAD